MCTYIQTYTPICICAYMYVCTHACMYAYMYIYIYIHIYTYIHINTHTHTHTHTAAHIPARRRANTLRARTSVHKLWRRRGSHHRGRGRNLSPLPPYRLSSPGRGAEIRTTLACAHCDGPGKYSRRARFLFLQAQPDVQGSVGRDGACVA